MGIVAALLSALVLVTAGAILLRSGLIHFFANKNEMRREINL